MRAGSLKSLLFNKLYYVFKLYKHIDHIKDNGRFLKILGEDYGHAVSRKIHKPVDSHMEPLPWFTYPAIEYLGQLDMRSKVVLEWGVGNSTLYFASRCKRIYSIEHNKEWYAEISSCLPSNANVWLKSEESYSTFPLDLGIKFDVIVIDGIRRGECVETALMLLNEGGLIIFDNSERDPEYCKRLREKNLIEVDMHGFGPINDYTWTTSFFFSRQFDIKPLENQPIVPIGGGL